MRALLQRVSAARVEVDGEVVGQIGPGLLVLLGVAAGDDAGTAEKLADRSLDLRIFPDDEKPMNVSVLDVDGEVLVVSQFTLAADTRRGRRPGFSTAMPPEQARVLVERFAEHCAVRAKRVATGRFGADMQVHLVNDGPVTFVLDSSEKS